MSTGTRQPLQLAILISGRGSNMAAIARACLDGSINARVSVVISDRPGVPGLTTARDLGIETHIVPWQSAGSRQAFERALRNGGARCGTGHPAIESGRAAGGH